MFKIYKKNRFKCFFGRHDWWQNKHVSFHNSNEDTYVGLEACISCGKVRVNVSGDVYVHDMYERWEELAGVKSKTTTPPLDERLMELKDLVDSAGELDLSKMDIDVESFKLADKEVQKEQKNESATGSEGTGS